MTLFLGGINITANVDLNVNNIRIDLRLHNYSAGEMLLLSWKKDHIVLRVFSKLIPFDINEYNIYRANDLVG